MLRGVAALQEMPTDCRLFPAARLHSRLQGQLFAVVSLEARGGAMLAEAEVGRVDREALVAALHVDHDFGDRPVGDFGEGDADAAVLGIDAGDGFEVDQAVQSGDQVGQLVAGGAQEDGAFQGFFEQRREGADVAVDGSRRQPAPLPPLAANWTLVQTVRMWAWSRKVERGRRSASSSRFASPLRGLKVPRTRGWAPRSVPPLNRRARRGLKPSFAQLAAWKGEERPTGDSSSGRSAVPAPQMVAFVCSCAQSVGLRVKFGRST